MQRILDSKVLGVPDSKVSGVWKFQSLILVSKSQGMSYNKELQNDAIYECVRGEVRWYLALILKYTHTHKKDGLVDGWKDVQMDR